MASETSEGMLMGFLKGSERVINAMMRRVIDRAGKQGRNYTDEEEIYLKRLEDALAHINRARFLAIQSEFRAEHETGKNKKH